MSYDLRDYLEIDHAEAARQWRAIQTRQPPARGKRQEPFRPIETVLCFGLFRILDPRRFGGGNIHLLPEVAQQLAATFRRPPGSLTNKMLNLSFERAHGGKAEPEVFLRLAGDRLHFHRLYATILEAARDVGLTDREVPDFIGQGWEPYLIGQDELGDEELGIALRDVEDAPATARLRGWFGESGTERIIEQRVRLGQHRFAAAVLANFDHRCGFCGFSPEGLGARGMLIASHVKPWSKCDDDRERLDPRNGIAACPTHDKAFDGGLLTVNGGLRIHRARGLEARLADRVTDSFFGPAVVQELLVVGGGGVVPAKKYLEYHRRHVFERAG